MFSLEDKKLKTLEKENSILMFWSSQTKRLKIEQKVLMICLLLYSQLFTQVLKLGKFIVWSTAKRLFPLFVDFFSFLLEHSMKLEYIAKLPFKKTTGYS